MSYLTKLQTYWKRKRIIPTYEDLCGVFNVKSKNASFKIIKRLIEEGFLKKEKRKIIPTKIFMQIGLPLYSEIRAGFPSPAEDFDEERISLDEYMIDHPNDSFLIRVKGNSMTDAGIFEGDVVIARKTSSPKEGDIVVASVDSEFTLKYLRRQKGKYVLEAGNKKYKTIEAIEELQIVGVVCGVLRKY